MSRADLRLVHDIDQGSSASDRVAGLGGTGGTATSTSTDIADAAMQNAPAGAERIFLSSHHHPRPNQPFIGSYWKLPGHSVALAEGHGQLLKHGRKAPPAGVGLDIGSARIQSRGDPIVTATPGGEGVPGVPAGDISTPAVAEPSQKPDIPVMTEAVKRSEMDARLEAVEARIDAKVADVRADIRLMSAKIDALAEATAVARAETATAVGDLRGDLADLRKEGREERRATRSLFVGSGLAVVTIILGTLYAIIQVQHSVGSMMQSAVSNVVSSLQTGVAIGQAVNPPK